jgi:hypothetical protein
VDGNAEMDIIDMAAAIPDGIFDQIVFEACLMANIEVAYEFRNKTKYLLSSAAEIVSPGFTDLYPTSINKLWDGYAGLPSFAQDAFDYFNKQSGWMQSATFSIIQTSELEALKNFVDTNADYTQSIDIKSIQGFDWSGYRKTGYQLFFDFEDYYSRLLATQNQQAELSTLINKAVVWKANTANFMQTNNGFAISKHSGMTVYIPQPTLPVLNEAYKKLQWTK